MDDTYKKQIMYGGYNQNQVQTLDDFFSYTQPAGSIEQAGSNVLRGISKTKIMANVPTNKDTQGFVFFTRPMLNLSKWNILNVRQFYSLLTTNENSVHRYVRCMLDPSLKDFGNPSVSSPLVDNKLVFIPLLTNTLISLSGWPDTVAPTFTSKQGIRKEQWSIIDGTAEVNETFDLDATFRNIADEPVSLLFKTWVNYGTYVFDGQMHPYRGMEARNEIDYTTRIYRLVMDKNERFVKKIACTIASFPVNEPTGKFFDFNRDKLYMDQTKEINIRFKCMGAVYNDEIIVRWFNTAAGYANPSLQTVVRSGFTISTSHTYEPIPHELLEYFKDVGYPLINPNTFELQWWVDYTSPSYKNIVASLAVSNDVKTIPELLKRP